jgi:hypothetical protein
VSEQERRQQEQQREKQIRRENREAHRKASDPAWRDRIDPSTGRTWRDAVGRGMYDDSRVQDFRDLTERARRDRERFRWIQARMQGRQGRN